MKKSLKGKISNGKLIIQILSLNLKFPLELYLKPQKKIKKTEVRRVSSDIEGKRIASGTN